MASLTSRSCPVRLRINTGRYTTLGTLNQPRLVSFHRSAAKYPGIFGKIQENKESVHIQTVLTTVVSVAETVMLARSLVNNYLPHEVRHYISYEIHRLVRPRVVGYFSTQMTITIQEFEGFGRNEVFEAAEAYLATKISSSNKKLRVSKHDEENTYNVTLERDEEVVMVSVDPPLPP
ncbi:unnamed protein product [Arabis nemorensis]|uniref:AAA-type ATPase N-terminal domain-containing protein n=1 Tax=Arabis nemorensis TaxID=586526 RepID=A0A565BKT5_9BRAS|nr:unnamed protein product [Arabis nemorensis]